MNPINVLWSILVATVQVGIDINNNPIYINPTRVQIENQQNFIAPTSDLMISLLQVAPSSQIGIQKNIINVSGGGLQEQIVVLYRSIIAIELFSKDNSSVTQKDLLMAYLNSYTSRNIQAQNSIFIAEISQNPISLSQIEGADRLNRFRFEVSVNHSMAITNNIPYYDTNFTPQIIINN